MLAFIAQPRFQRSHQRGRRSHANSSSVVLTQSRFQIAFQLFRAFRHLILHLRVTPVFVYNLLRVGHDCNLVQQLTVVFQVDSGDCSISGNIITFDGCVSRACRRQFVRLPLVRAGFGFQALRHREKRRFGRTDIINHILKVLGIADGLICLKGIGWGCHSSNSLES